jgi:hypothetical protein
MDSDEEEMKSLRKAPQYAQHASLFGTNCYEACVKGGGGRFLLYKKKTAFSLKEEFLIASGRQSKESKEKASKGSFESEDQAILESGEPRALISYFTFAYSLLGTAEALTELNLPTEFGKKDGRNSRAAARARMEQLKRAEAMKVVCSVRVYAERIEISQISSNLSPSGLETNPSKTAAPAPAPASAAPAPSPTNTTPEEGR